MRREVFQSLGGFDPTQVLEDVELGYRLRRHGHRVLLDRELQVKHLKAWTLRSMIRTDIIMRALPWARLILSTGTAPVALNLRTAGRWSVALTALALVLTVLSPLEPFLLLLAGVVVAAIIALNAGFQDHAMLTGILAARNHGAGERNDVWKVNADQDYHEEERRPAVLEPSLAER